MTEKLNTLLFDLDDTLLMSNPAQLDALEKLLEPLKIPASHIREAYACAENWLSSRNIIMNATGRRIPENELRPGVCAIYGRMLGLSREYTALIADTAMGNYARDRCLRQDTMAFLGELRAAGIKTGIVSNNPPQARVVVQKFGLETALDCIVISGEEGIAKPDARIIEIALKKLGAESGSAAFVGDSPYDMLCAQNAGVSAWWMDNGVFGGMPEGIAAPDAIVKSIGEIRQLVFD